MKIGFGCDHAAIDLKNELIEYMTEKGYECVDYGTGYDENGEIMLSYFLGNNFRSMGYAQEACGKILEYAREELEFDRIVAVIAPDNLPSIRLAVSLGFRRAKETVYQKKTGDLYVWQEHPAS